MASLFDIAADLSQYNDDGDSTAKAKLQAVHPQSALGILDETFETIYGAQQYRSASRRLPLIRSATTGMIQLQPTRLAVSKSSEALDARLKRLSSWKSPATAPRRMNPARTVASLIIPPPPAVPPPPQNSRKMNNVAQDPDSTAKAALREVTNEINQLKTSNTSSIEEEESLLRMLSDKYIHAQLSKLPGTPFVLLVRKKVAQKLQQLEQHLSARRTIHKPVVTNRESNYSSNNNNSSSSSRETSVVMASDSTKSLHNLTPAQHEMLQNLLRLPEKQLLKLPKAQLELVQFAKRYDKLVKATPDQLRHLPIEHQQLVRRMQQQQKQLSRIDRN